MDDKELIKVWRAEFESLAEKGDNLKKCGNGQYIEDSTFYEFYGFCKSKRSQPSVVLPENYYAADAHDINGSGAEAFDSAIDDVKAALTAAGIKYTVGE